MRHLIFALTLILLSVAGAQTQKVLHVSTIPRNADIYEGTGRADHANKPDYQSPAFIPISPEQDTLGEIQLHLFHPECNDTTIRVKLSQKDTSYLVVSLQPIYDEILLKEQQGVMGKRSRRSFGKKLMFASIIPFVAGGIAGIVTYYQIDQANTVKKRIDKAQIKAQSYDEDFKDFKDFKDNAKTAKTATITSLAIGASFLTAGFILSF